MSGVTTPPGRSGPPKATRALSFGAVAADYDRFRPAPPPAALRWLLPERVGAALDVGAGTGALTRRVLARADAVIAVEPDSRMRALLARRMPQVRALPGTAESLPLPDASMDAVLVCNAWHWVDPDRAVPEIARVLKPGGVLAILWNFPDREHGPFADLRAMTRAAAGGSRRRGPRHDPRGVRLPAGSPFGPPDITVVRWTWRTSPRTLVGLMGTFSSVITLPDERRERLLEDVARYMAARPELAERARLALPATCHCWRAVRLPAPE